MRTDNRKKVEELGIKYSYTLGNEHYFYCPFHAESKPSFCVSAINSMWYCFSCEKGGSLFTLRKLLYEDSEEHFSMLVSKLKEGKIERELDEDKSKKILVNLKLEEFDSLPIAGMCKYFATKNLTEETIKKWDIRRTYLFLVIPVKDRKRESQGLIFRAILPDGEPRYQYSFGFQKNNHLFGIDHFGRDSISEPNMFDVILVEGSFDVIKMHQFGFTNTVSILGSSLGEGQMKILRRLGNRIFIFLDNDEKGVKCTKKIAEQLLREFDVFVPDFGVYRSKDPGESNKEEVVELLKRPVNPIMSDLLRLAI